MVLLDFSQKWHTEGSWVQGKCMTVQSHQVYYRCVISLVVVQFVKPLHSYISYTTGDLTVITQDDMPNLLSQLPKWYIFCYQVLLTISL